VTLYAGLCNVEFSREVVMGQFGIQIAGEGPGDYAESNGSLGTEADAALEAFGEELETLGFTIFAVAVLAPGAPGGAAEAVHLPVEDGAFKCPECGLTFPQAGVCTGGEYGHPAATTVPAEQVLAAPADGTEPAPAEAPAEAPTPATSNAGDGAPAAGAPASATAPAPPPPEWPAG
jgi:hypothetical protein